MTVKGCRSSAIHNSNWWPPAVPAVAIASFCFMFRPQEAAYSWSYRFWGRVDNLLGLKVGDKWLALGNTLTCIFVFLRRFCLYLFWQTVGGRKNLNSLRQWFTEDIFTIFCAQLGEPCVLEALKLCVSSYLFLFSWISVWCARMCRPLMYKKLSHLYSASPLL